MSADMHPPVVPSGVNSEFDCGRTNSKSSNRIFVRLDSRLGQDLPCRELLEEHFRQFGKVVDCYMPESATNVAYVCFEEPLEMERAIQQTQQIVAGTCLQVSRAAPRPDYSAYTDRVFVKNVPESVSWQDLKMYFQQYGEVSDVYIPKDKLTGKQKRFAFVTYKDLTMARRCLAEERHSLHQQPVTVMPAEPRPQKRPEATSPMMMGAMHPMQPYLLQQLSPYGWPPMDQITAALAPVIAANMQNMQSLASLTATTTPSTVQDNGPARVFVQGLHPCLTQDTIRAHFAQFGRVTDVYIPKHNPEICFVTMATREEMERGICGSQDLQIQGFPVSMVKKADARAAPRSLQSTQHNQTSVSQQQLSLLQQHQYAAAAAQAAAYGHATAQSQMQSLAQMGRVYGMRVDEFDH